MISLTFKSNQNSSECYFDKDILEKILGNLLSNAFKFTPEKGNINVNLISNNNDYEITVEDTGRGIPHEELGKIFDRFYQISSTDSLRQHGTGIGLSLTKELVEMLNGTIKVNSSLKKGTSFIVTLPFLSQQEYHGDKTDIISKFELGDKYNFPEIIKYESEEIYEDKDDEVSGELPIVLIVEDNNEVRNFIKSNLEKSYSVIEASNGIAGFNQSIKHVPDLIISDIMMPEMDGYELCKKLKTDERTSHIPVILLTAKASVEDKLEGLETGADDYLQKPFNSKELAARISNLITQREKLRKRFSRELFLQPKDIAITPADEKFLTRAMDIIEKNLSDPDFSVEIFGEEIGMSRVQLYRKIKALTDQSVSDFVRTMRLKRAAKLLKMKSASVTEICYEVGFNNLSYFAKTFKDLFGVSPSDYN